MQKQQSKMDKLKTKVLELQRKSHWSHLLIQEDDLPTAEQLAMVAASVTSSSTASPKEASERALEIWKHCHERILKERLSIAEAELHHLEEYRPILDRIAPWPLDDGGNPKQKLSMNKFLALVLPHQNTSDLQKYYREYLKDSVRLNRWRDKGNSFSTLPKEEEFPPPTEEEIEEWFCHKNDEGFDALSYNITGYNIAKWWMNRPEFDKKKFPTGSPGAEKEAQKS